MVRETHSADESMADDGVISPSLRRRLQQCFEHGAKLMAQEKYDYDYAHSILVECVVRDPGNAVYLDAFFENLRRKYNNNKRGALLHFGGRGPFKKALARQDWRSVLRLGPEILKSSPWDVPTLRGLADGCAALGHGETELRFLKIALEAAPKDADVNRHCAKSLARWGHFDQAITCWTRVDEITHGDAEAQKMISQLQIAKTHHRASVGGDDRTSSSGGKRGAKATSPTRESPADRRREIELTPRQQLEQAVANNPTDLASYFELVDLHLAEDRLGDAVLVLNKAVAASGGDLTARQRLEDVEILRKQRQLAVAERRAADSADDQARALAEQLRADLNRFELEVYHARAERFPEDREHQYQLGVRLKRAGNYRPAVGCFQESFKLPERAASARLEAGECLQHLKQYDKALHCYLRAVELAESPELVDIRKLALYRAAVLATGLGSLDVAEQHLRGVLEIDPTYKDVAARLDKIAEIRHKG